MADELYQPVPPGTKRKFSPQQALNEIIKLVDPKYEVYFRTGTVKLQSGSRVSSEERQLIRSLRTEILSGGNVERVYNNINRFLTAGSTFRNNRAQVAAVLGGTNYIRPVEDPAGRDPSTPGFGRAPGQVEPEQDGAPPVMGVDERRAGVEETDGLPSFLQPIELTEELPVGVRAPEETTPSGGDGTPSVTGDISDVAEEPADSNIPEDWREAAREMYPQYYAIVRNIPEIAQLLETAINESYTPEKFQAELEQTNWFQQTSGSAREWEINSQRDPASAQRQIDEQIVRIRDLALSSFGVRLSDERLSELAEDSLRFGWSNRFLQNAIGDVATTSTTGVSQLREGYIGQQLRATANDYGISVSDATFNRWVNKVAVGQESTASWEDYAKVQAKNLFPSISERIDAGETFQEIIDPYRESAAALLEIDGGTIDFKQPDWIKAVTFQDEKGEQRPMSFTEWNDYVRQNRSFGYEYTEQAQRRAYQVANSLANLFGKV